VTLKAGAAGVVIVLLLLGAIYALATRSSSADTPSTEPSIATIVAGGSQLRTPTPFTIATLSIPTVIVAPDANPIELPTDPITSSPPPNATELASGSYGMTRDSSGFRLTDTFVQMNCVGDDVIELETSSGRYWIQIPAFPGYECAQALESLERSRASARGANPGVGLEYLRGQEGRTNQVLIGWENGASNTLSVQGVFQPS